MYAYVVTDGEVDFIFTLRQTSEEACLAMVSAMQQRRVLVHPLHELTIRRVTGVSHEQIAAASSPLDALEQSDSPLRPGWECSARQCGARKVGG